MEEMKIPFKIPTCAQIGKISILLQPASYFTIEKSMAGISLFSQAIADRMEEAFLEQSFTKRFKDMDMIDHHIKFLEKDQFEIQIPYKRSKEEEIRQLEEQIKKLKEGSE